MKNNINFSTLEILQDTTRQAHKKKEVTTTKEIPQGASINVSLAEINLQGSNTTKQQGRKKKKVIIPEEIPQGASIDIVPEINS